MWLSLLGATLTLLSVFMAFLQVLAPGLTWQAALAERGLHGVWRFPSDRSPGAPEQRAPTPLPCRGPFRLEDAWLLLWGEHRRIRASEGLSGVTWTLVPHEAAGARRHSQHTTTEAALPEPAQPHTPALTLPSCEGRGSSVAASVSGMRKWRSGGLGTRLVVQRGA